MQRIISAAAVLVITSAFGVSAQQPAKPSVGTAARTPGSGPAAAVPRTGTKLLPGTRPNVLCTIRGTSLNSTDGQLPEAAIRLRDARSGRIVDTTTSDTTGAFAFPGLDPGSYVVELMGPDQTVAAATRIINVNAGDTVSALVKLPFRTSRLAGIFRLANL